MPEGFRVELTSLGWEVSRPIRPLGTRGVVGTSPCLLAALWQAWRNRDATVGEVA